MNIENLTPQERAALMAEIDAQNKRDAAEKKQRLQDYRDLVDESITESMAKLKETSRLIALAKRDVYEVFGVVLDLKSELFSKKADDNISHTFTSSDGRRRITLGYHMLDNYDDTVNDGIAMVKGYITSLATDEKGKQLVNAVLRLLAKDQSGNLKAGRVMQLDKLALESGDKDFIEGVRIIKEAYRPIQSKQYIRAQVKGAQNEWVNVPLGMTEA